MNKLKIIIISCFLIMLMVTSNIAAEEKIILEIEKTVIQPLDEIVVIVKLIGDEGELLKEDRRILLRVSKGGVLNLENVRQGLQLKDGVASFTYLAPEEPGRVDITLVDIQNNLSNKTTLEVTQGEVQANWRREDAMLKEIKGRVFVKYANNDYWDTAVLNKKVYQGDGVKTMEKSWVTLDLFDGSEVVLEPLTELVIKNLSSMEDDNNVKQGIFELLKGNVLCSARKFVNKGSRFSIETESAAAGVRGTYFEVSFQDGKVEVTVYRGSVRIAHKATGQVYVVNKGEKLTMPEDDTAPVLEENVKTEKERKEKLEEDIVQATGNNSGDDSDDSGSVIVEPDWGDDNE